MKYNSMQEMYKRIIKSSKRQWGHNALSNLSLHFQQQQQAVCTTKEQSTATAR